MRAPPLLALALLLAGPGARAGLAEELAALRDRPQAAAELAADRCEENVVRDPVLTQEAVRLGLPLARNYPRDRAALLICRGYLAESAGQLKAAQADYGAADEAAAEAKDVRQRSQALALRGEVRQRLGAYDEALADLLAAHRLAPAGGAHQRYALNAIANFYADPHVGQFAQALDYYRQLQAAHHEAGNTADATTAVFNQASTLQRLERYAEAEPLYRQALQAYEGLGDLGSVGETQRALATLLLRSERAAEALPLAERALAGALQNQDEELRMSSLLTRGAALRKLGRLREAEPDLQAALAYYRTQGNPRFQAHALGELAELEASRQQWPRAYAMRSEQFKLEQQLRTRQQQELSSRLRMQFDVARMEQQASAAQRESALRASALRDAARIRQLQWALLGLGGLLAVGLGVWAWRAVGRASRFATLAYSDALTGVPNRRAVLERLEEGLRRQPPAQVLMIDIDHFKSINDRYGHEAGDRVLREVAQTLRASLGEDGMLGRLGGEEFLVLAPQGDLADLAERLRTAVAGLRCTDELADLRISISLGGARARAGELRSEQLLQRADEALYRAKAEGRDRAVLAPD